MRGTKSVVICCPTNGSKSNLSSLFKSIENLPDFVKRFVVINNNFKHTCLSKHDFPGLEFDVEFVNIKELGLHHARNYALITYEEDLIAYIDDDVILSKAYFAGLSKAINECFLVCGGPSIPQDRELKYLLNNEEGIKTYNASLSLISYDSIHYDTHHYIYGCNMIVDREALVRIGGFLPDGVPKEFWYLRGSGETGTFEKLKDQQFLYLPDLELIHQVPVSRRTLEYDIRRIKSQAVSDTYAAIRKYSIFGIVRVFAAFALRIIKVNNLLLEYYYISEVMKYLKVYCTNPSLRLFVIKENYLQENYHTYEE